MNLFVSLSLSVFTNLCLFSFSPVYLSTTVCISECMPLHFSLCLCFTITLPLTLSISHLISASLCFCLTLCHLNKKKQVRTLKNFETSKFCFSEPNAPPRVEPRLALALVDSASVASVSWWVFFVRFHTHSPAPYRTSVMTHWHSAKQPQGEAGNPYWGGRLCTVDILIKIGCFVKNPVWKTADRN